MGILGVVPPHIAGTRMNIGQVSPRPWLKAATASPFDAGGPTDADNLTDDGPDQGVPLGVADSGPTMETNQVYAIFWVPTGFTTASNYKSTIDGFFHNVQTDSGSATNMYATDTQYDTNGTNIQYDSTYEGSAVDTQKFPTGDCTDPSAVIGTTVCLGDDQIQAEVQRFADAQGWPHGPNVEFFLYTPANVGSCFYPGPAAGNICAYDYYCAYHSAFFTGNTTDTEYIYANMPWPNQKYVYLGHTYPSVCDTGQHPNGTGSYPTEAVPTPSDAADEVINVTSHEHNESITDPTGYAWWVDNGASAFFGYEDGDLCAWYTPDSSVLGWTGKGQFNVIIGTGVYFTQGEWSNMDATADPYSGCMWSDPKPDPPVENGAPGVTGTAMIGDVLTSDQGDFSNATAYSYQWQRCDTNGDNCIDIPGALLSTYTLQNADGGHELRVDLTAANAGGTTSDVSDPTGIVATSLAYPTTAPSIDGTPTVGQTLTGHAGVWVNTTPTSKFTFLWLRCNALGTGCKTIKTIVNTTGDDVTYVLAAADDKLTIRLSVQVQNTAGKSFPVISDPEVGPVDGEPTPNGGDPSIDPSPTPTVGNTLTGHVGPWASNAFPITSYRVAWVRCPMFGACKSVKIATLKPGVDPTSTYRLVALDDKATIEFTVVAVNKAGSSAMDDGTVGPVDGEPESGDAFITGTDTVGSIVTANTTPGNWTPAATKYAFQWERCDDLGANCTVFKKVVAGKASTTTYKLATADHGTTLRVIVIASNTAGSSNPVESDATSLIP